MWGFFPVLVASYILRNSPKLCEISYPKSETSSNLHPTLSSINDDDWTSLACLFVVAKDFTKKRIKIYNNWTAGNTECRRFNSLNGRALVVLTSIWIKFWETDMVKISWKFRTKDNVITGRRKQEFISIVRHLKGWRSKYWLNGDVNGLLLFIRSFWGISAHCFWL